MVKTTYPDEKGISSSDSRETNEKRQMQETGNGSNQVSCEFYPSGLSLSPQPRETFEWNSLANMTKTPFVLLLPELGPPEISQEAGYGEMLGLQVGKHCSEFHNGGGPFRDLRGD